MTEASLTRAWALMALSMAMQAASALWVGNPAYDMILEPLALVPGLLAVASAPPLKRSALLLALTLSAFAWVMLGRWLGGYSEPSLLGGRIPISDAAGYVRDAMAFLHGDKLSAFASRRPIFTLLLGGLLKLSGGNLMIAMALMAVMASLAMAALVESVWRGHGTVVGGVLFLLLFFFYRRFAGVPLTEQAGFAVGCLGTAFLWRGAEDRTLAKLCSGMALLSVALNARAGAFFVLPLLVLWIGWLRRGARRFDIMAATAAAGSAGVAFAVNALLVNRLGTPGGGFSNFSYSFYGLLFGGNWMLVLDQHPELIHLDELERTQRIMAMATEAALASPLLVVKGAARALAAFFAPGKGQFAFIYLFPEAAFAADLRSHGVVESIRAAIAAEWGYRWLCSVAWYLWFGAAWVCEVAGLVHLWRRRRDGHSLLLLAGFGGVLLSLPFAPPWDADGMRVYAASIPLQASITALGAAALVARWKLPVKKYDFSGSGSFSLAVALTALAALSVLPFAAVLAPVVSVPGPAPTCREGQPHPLSVVGGTQFEGAVMVYVEDRGAVTVADFAEGALPAGGRGWGCLMPLEGRERVSAPY